MAAGVRLEDQTTDLRAAPLRQTDEPLDLAVDGEGYFGVQTDDGVRYTRNGRFATGADGTLVDQHGQRGRSAATVSPSASKADGTVDPPTVGVFDAHGRRQGRRRPASPARPTGQAAGKVRTGALEGSGVDAARTMVEMMASLRAYEAGQKALTTIDDTLGRAAAARLDPLTLASPQVASAPRRRLVNGLGTATRGRRAPHQGPDARRHVLSSRRHGRTAASARRAVQRHRERRTRPATSASASRSATSSTRPSGLATQRRHRGRRRRRDHRRPRLRAGRARSAPTRRSTSPIQGQGFLQHAPRRRHRRS